MVEAHMRNGVTGGVERLDILPEVDNAIAVLVPAFGVLLVGPAKVDTPIVRLGSPSWLGLLVQPDADNRFSEASNKVQREGRIVGEAVEFELLPNSSGEDRLVVVIKGAIAGAQVTDGE